MKKIILASGSKRRIEILSMFKVPFEVIVSSCDEIISGNLSPSEIVINLSCLKATDVANIVDYDALVIGFDTIVYLENKILQKPTSREDAFNMLSSLSSKTHSVYTGFTIFESITGNIFSDFCKTDVTFKNITSERINLYLDTDEPYDKAGGYGIQGYGSLLIECIHGDYFNVVGLPIAKVSQIMLEKFDIDLLRGN